MDRPSDAPREVSESAESRSSRLSQRLRHITEVEGTIGFDRFMELALYDSFDGYYRHPEASPVGPQGDFYTAPDLGPVFGACIAQRILGEFDRLGKPRSFEIVEVGFGRGILASSILDALGRSREIGSGWRYVLVGESDPMTRRALARLDSIQVRSDIDVRTRPGLGSEGPFTGVVIANELLDALPARRLVYRDGHWTELGVRWTTDGGSFEPMARPVELTDPPPLPADHEGAILEYAPAARGLLRELGDHLARGTAILADYGDEELALVRGHPEGTLRAVRRHRLVPDPLAFPGSLDLSTFVNWTRVRIAARTAGLLDRGLRSQASSLGEWGAAELIERWIAEAENETERVRRRLQAKNLLFGFDGFYVLELEARSSSTNAAR